MKKNLHLGLSIDGNQVTLVESDLNGAPPTVSHVATLTLKSGATNENAETLHRLLKEKKVLAKSVNVCLPHRLAAVKSIRVPSADPNEIRSMALLQACRLMPFSPEEIVAGYESVETSSEGFTRILLTVVRKEDVLPALTLCRGAGLRVKRILLDTHALPALVADQLNFPCLLVMAEDREGLVAMIEKNIPRFARTFPWDGTAEGLAREAELSVEAYQKEIPFWNPAKVVWLGDDPIGAIRKALESKLNAPFDVFQFPEPLKNNMAHSAYAAASAAQVGTNLLPEIEQKRQAREYKMNQQKIFAVLSLFLALSLAGLGWARLRQMQAKISALDRERIALSQSAEGLEEKADRLEEARRTEGRAGLLDILRALKAVLPSGVSLNGFSYERHGRVVLQGESTSLAEALATVGAVEKTALFQKVELRNSDAVTINGKEMAQFQIVCEPKGGNK
ncbi:MAG: PilN domain-containing protein [Elusimicrobia bacterium]|nr:PilN domain-containing protein [Elusimicrobiota bacterium]